jgi:septum formation protein
VKLPCPGRAMLCRDMNARSATLVLASASAVRTRLLTSAGVAHRVDPAHVDEASVREALLAEQAPHSAIAETLAELKAQKISRDHDSALVLGADQVLSCAGALFEKPVGPEGVREHLRALMGKPHTLHTSACIVRDGTVMWHANTDAVLHMRTLSEAFVSRYIEAVGEAVCQSVGAYQLEGMGAQLFSRIEGDFFDILGLPLLPLLEFLRDNGMLER